MILARNARLVMEDYPLDNQDLVVLRMHNPPTDEMEFQFLIAVRPKEAPPGSFTWLARAVSAHYAMPLEITTHHPEP